jgi:gas vesicle protein
MAEQERTDQGSDLGGKLAWFLAGAALGAIIALLYAPRDGKHMRQALSRTAERGKEAVAETASDLVETGRDMFERGRKLVEDAADLFERGRKLVQG